MNRPIVKDAMFLSRRSAAAGREDMHTAADLKDTLQAHRNECVGMAANMIGVPKRIIAVVFGPAVLVMFNPVIVKRSGPYETQEGCLSLSGMRRTVRYKTITVTWQDENFAEKTSVYTGTIAQIIQHECDHLEGILI